jgi:ribosome biogenesis GTPase A
MSIQWFPGHMVAAQKKAAETIEFTDVVIEVLDARIPGASQNPVIQDLSFYRQRAHLKVLNKSDLADSKITNQWVSYFNRLPKTKAIAISCKKGNEVKKIFSMCKTLAPHRGSSLKPLRMMIMGVPNVGKSTLMNALLHKRIAKVGNEPAITKQQQRHQVNDHMVLIDTPGLMWPKIESPSDGKLLAINYMIGQNAYFEEEVAVYLATLLIENYPAMLKDRYKLVVLPTDPIKLLESIVKKRGYTSRGKGLDLERAYLTILQDYREGLIGRISLESPHSRAQMKQGDIALDKL